MSASGKSVVGYKPVAKGSKETPDGLRNKDALVLQSVSTIKLPYEAINPIALSEEESSISHHGPINYSLLSGGMQRLADQMDHVVVEGTGGWRSLMNDLRPLSDWVVQEQLPVLLVVGIQEGCINHALLTAPGHCQRRAAVYWLGGEPHQSGPGALRGNYRRVEQKTAGAAGR